MNQQLKQLILRALLSADGVPMPEAALVGAVQTMARPERPTMSDVAIALKGVEAHGWAAGLSDTLTGTTWSLTDAGRHRAAQL